MPRYVPRRFVASTSSHSSTSISQNERISVRAALLTSTSHLAGLPEQALPGLEAADVVLDRLAADLGGHLLGSRQVQVGEQHPVAVGSEPARDRLAETACRARDDGGAPFASTWMRCVDCQAARRRARSGPRRASARIESAVSAVESAPMSRPHGPAIRSIASSPTPLSRSRSRFRSWLRRPPISPT